MTDTLTDPPSDPGTDDEPTRVIVRRLERAHQRGQGAATWWRAAGGIGVTAALGIAAAAVGYAQQAAVDHERVGRLEADRERTETDVRAMRGDLDAIRSSLARIEGRLERDEP